MCKIIAYRHQPHTGILMLFVLAALLAGCGGRSTIAIKDLLDDPSRYNEQTVRVVGRVTENIGLMGVGAYRLDDGTGTITVVSRQGGAPRKGAEVEVDGRFRSAFTIGSSAAAVIMETQRTSK